MAQGTATPLPPAPPPLPNEQSEEFNRYIDVQLRTTRSRVKWVEAAGASMLLVVGSLMYLLAMVLVDHWAVSGGLGFGGRLVALAVFLAGAMFFTVRTLLPLVVRRINPDYAAEVIEQSTPSLKNSLINLLQLRRNQAGVSQQIFRGMEHQAAANLSAVPMDSVVDRSRLIKVGYWMAGIVLVIAMYKVLSPKDPIRSMERVMAPWADIDAPTRVTIAEVSPGDHLGFHDQRFAVTALVKGAKADEPVLLHFSTADGQVLDQTLKMRIPESGNRHATEVPESTGLKQDLTYYITAGDARSRDYHVRVQTMPSIVVERVDYAFPKYTGIAPQSVDRVGDLRALEGTEVTLHAKATHPIKSAYLDFERDGRRDLTLVVKGRDASTQFKLALKPKSDVPEHANYQLLFTNTDGFDNPRPIEYKIEVIRDLPPEIAFLEPRPEPMPEPQPAGEPKKPAKDAAKPIAPTELALSSQGTLPMVIEASDPDFQLSKITLMAERVGKPAIKENLLAAPSDEKPVKVRHFFEAKKYQLQPGETVIYWAVAEDNKEPTPNRTETPRYTLRITSPDQKPDPNKLAQKDPPKRDKPQDQPPQNKQQPNQPNQPNDANRNQPNQQPNQQPNPQDGQPQNQKPNENAPGQQQPGQQPDQKPGDKQDGSGQADQQNGPGQKQDSERRVDPNNPGDVIDKVNDHFDKQQQDKKPEDKQQNKSDKQQPEKPGDQQRPQPDQQPGQSPDRNQGDKNQGNKGGQDQQPGQEKSGQQKPGGEQPGQQPQGKSGEQPQQKPKNDGQPDGSAGEKSGQPNDQKSPGDSKSGDKQGGKDSSGSPGGKDGAGQPSGDKQGGEKGSEGSTGAREKSDGNKDGSKPGSSGEKSATEKQPGEQGQPGSEKGQPGAEKMQPGGEKSGLKKDGDKDAVGKEPGAEQGTKPGEKSQPGQSKQGEKPGDKPGEKPGEKAAGGPPDDKQLPSKSEETGEKKAGAGGQSKDPNEQRPGEKPAGDSQSKPDAKGGDRETSKGESGAGQKSEDKQGTPSPQEQAKPREKMPSGEQSGDSKPNPDEGSSPSNSKSESNSKGGADGDRSGGGQKGGGQKSDQSGTGGAGKSTAAEQGGATSNEKGEGETSNQGGDKTPAGKPKDNAKSQQTEGPGSKSQPGGKQPGKGDENNGGDRSQQKPGENPSQQKSSSEPGAFGKGNPTAGGMGDNKDVPLAKPLPPGAEPGGDDPNLKYAREASDLAIERLKDQLQKGEPDEQLLKDLNWTRADVERFVKHWEQMKRDAQTPGDDASRERFNQALSSLGLRPKATSLEAKKNAGDKNQGLRQSRRSSPPPDYADQFRGYSKESASGGKVP